MNKIRVLAGLLTLLFASIAVMAADQTVYKGKLNPELSWASPYMQYVKPASAETIAKLPKAPAEGDEVLTEYLAGIPVVLVVPENGKEYFYFDQNQDGKFQEAERFSFPEKDKLELKLPTFGIFKSVAIKLSNYVERPRTPRAGEEKPAARKPKRGIVYEVTNITTGTVDIGGQNTLVQYRVGLQSKSVNPTRGKMGVDCNGNGQIEDGNVETYNAYYQDEKAVFRVGKHYVATKSVDVNTGEVIMEARPASEYTRIELMVGGVVPDFAYRDLDGKTHRFAELLGKNKYLLLDFWGSW